MVNSARPHRVKRLAFVCAFFIATVCLGQTGQSRHLEYSTYGYPWSNSVFSFEDIVVVAANAAGQVCVADGYYQLEINADGSQAYLMPSSSFLTKPVGAGRQIVLAIDDAGDCYQVSGGTITPTPGAFQSNKPSGNFVVKFNPNGGVIFATYLGGSGDDISEGVVLDSSQNVWVTGSTASNDFPTKNAIQASPQGGPDDAFIAELSADGTQLLFGTYLGGNGSDSANGIALDSSNNAYVSGTTSSTNFPLFNPLESSLQASQAAFVTKVNNSGVLLYSTYLGQTSEAGSNGIAVDSTGAMWVTGTAGDGFPLVNPIQSTDLYSSFISKLNPAGSALVFSTYFGTAYYFGEQVAPAAIQLDGQGNAYVAGTLDGSEGSTEPTVPLLNPVESTPYAGYVAALDPNGTLLFSSYFGGLPNYMHDNFLAFGTVTSLSVNNAGDIFLGAFTEIASPIPLLSPIYGTVITDAEFGYNVIGYASRVALGSGPSFSMPSSVAFGVVDVGNSVVWSFGVYNTGTTDITISSIVTSGDYSQTNTCPTTILAATDCAFQVTFTPTANGPRLGAITITDNSPGSPHVIQLTGNVGTGGVTISPTSLTFASQQVGTISPPQKVNITNSGTAALQIYQVLISGDFQEFNNCNLSVPPNSNCAITVTFVPTAAGQQTGTLTIVDSAPGSPQMIGLTGTGTGGSGGSGLGLGVAPGGSNSATVSAGGTANYSLAIGGAGVSGTATLTCTGAPTGATCSLPSSINVSGSSSSPFTVSVKTTGSSANLAPFDLRLKWTWAMGLIGLLFGPGRTCSRWTSRLLPFALLLCLCGCGGGSGSSSTGGGSTGNTGTPTGTYTLTVQATMGSTVQSMPLTLKV